MSLNAEIILAVVALLGCLGGGIRYVLSRIDSERTRMEAERIRYELKIDHERVAQKQLIDSQFAEMRSEMRSQDREILYLRRVSDTYSRYIDLLRHLLREAGVKVPDLTMPDYPSRDEGAQQ